MNSPDQGSQLTARAIILVPYLPVNPAVPDISHRDNIEDHFPTTVLERQHESKDVADLNLDLRAAVLDLEKRYRHTPENAVNSGVISTQGGYQTSVSMNLFESKIPAIQAFVERIVTPGARDYVRHVFGDESSKLDPWPVGWANVLRQGDWQGPHMHPTHQNIASAVYYVSLPGELEPPQGCIEFINPHPISVHHGFANTRRLQPAEGKLILFPPWYMHYVHPFRSDGERVIIAFDVLSQRPGGQFVF